MKILKKIAVLALIALLILQFFGPEKNESDIADLQPFLTETNPPASVQATLKVACFDCHSNNTRSTLFRSDQGKSHQLVLQVNELFYLL